MNSKWLLIKDAVQKLVRRPEETAPPPDQLEIETDQERRANFLRMLNRGWLAFGLVTLLALPFQTDQWLIYAIILVATFSTYLLIRALNRAGRTMLAGYLFCALVDVAFYGLFMALVRQFGAESAFRTEATVWMLMGLAIVFAGLLINKWATFGLAAINTVVFISTRMLLAPQSDLRPSVVVFWGLLALSVWLYEDILIKAFARLRTTRASLETIIAARTRNLQDTVSRLESAKTELEIRNKELEAFSYSVSHDLRAPLRAISAFSTMLMDDYGAQLPEPAQADLDRVRSEAHRMSQLIDDLLAFSRLGRQAIQKQSVDMQALVQEVLAEAYLDIDGSHYQIVVGELPPCQADLALLKQVWVNLIGNALKFTRYQPAPHIEIGSRIGVERLYFIKDNGAGFDMRYAHKLFNVFQRLHTSDQFEGTGAGLAIVSRIIQRHSGRIWAEAEVNKGATFYFTLGG